MRPSNALSLAQTARLLSQRRLVRVQLTAEVPGLGRAGSTVLVQPGRMRNELLPSKKAIYQPLPTPTSISSELRKASQVEAQLQAAQEKLQADNAREVLTRQIGAIQLLSLRRKLESVPPITFTRQTTTKYKGRPAELPEPALTIQGSISPAEIVTFLREAGTFDLETDYSVDNKPVELNRLTASQINTACEFLIVPAASSKSSTDAVEGVDKLGRIKKTGRYEFVTHILSSNVRVRIPITVQPTASSVATAPSTSSNTSTSATFSSTSAAVNMASSSPSVSTSTSTPGQARGYATHASSRPTTMEASMRQKLQAEFGPEVEINIRNDSSKHAHHAAMAAQGGGNGETHFYVEVISDKFAGMSQIKRHRAVNALLQHEFDRGLHALSLRTKTFKEENRPPTSAATSNDGQVIDGTVCPSEQGEVESDIRSQVQTQSPWTAPQSTQYPTSPLRHENDSRGNADAWSQQDKEVLESFYQRPRSSPSPSVSAASTPTSTKRGARDSQAAREKYFRRVTQGDAVIPTRFQNLINVLGGIFAVVSATYMVLFAEFNRGASGNSENCFDPVRAMVWGPQGPPKLFGQSDDKSPPHHDHDDSSA
ncbi:bola-domain-containing protein [Testicularia cyperi]|uniref:Bola-domain-containing protein n=1 Tax=Testicularia cyperi TaxID=1882483 RepID=A0A317XR44_9BASI|nr:bola-domain-containing protein [Testicularia cyperi]